MYALVGLVAAGKSPELIPMAWNWKRNMWSKHGTLVSLAIVNGDSCLKLSTPQEKMILSCPSGTKDSSGVKMAGTQGESGFMSPVLWPATSRISTSGNLTRVGVAREWQND